MERLSDPPCCYRHAGIRYRQPSHTIYTAIIITQVSSPHSGHLNLCLSYRYQSPKLIKLGHVRTIILLEFERQIVRVHCTICFAQNQYGTSVTEKVKPQKTREDMPCHGTAEDGLIAQDQHCQSRRTGHNKILNLYICADYQPYYWTR